MPREKWGSAGDISICLGSNLSDPNTIIQAPEPYVWITEFGNFAIEYTLYVFINQIKRIPVIDANLKRTVLATCRKHGIDISTPRLLRTVEE